MVLLNKVVLPILLFCHSLLLVSVSSSNRPQPSPNRLQARSLRDSCVSDLLSKSLTVLTVAGMATTSFPSPTRATDKSQDDLIPNRPVAGTTQVLAELMSVEVAAAFIQTHCTVMLQAARTTGRVLYRGEPIFLSQGGSSSGSTGQRLSGDGSRRFSVPKQPKDKDTNNTTGTGGDDSDSGDSYTNKNITSAFTAMISKNPLLLYAPPDLLDESTYGNPLAVDFFDTISVAMETKANKMSKTRTTCNQPSTTLNDDVSKDRNGNGNIEVGSQPALCSNYYVATPRNGHLATPDILQASVWGPVVSVWPLDNMHYSILATEKAWWRDDWGYLRGPRGPSFWRNPTSRDAFIDQEIKIDRGLEGALARGAEVLFSSDVDGTTLTDLMQLMAKNKAKASTARGKNKVDLMDSNNNNNNNNNGRKSCSHPSRFGSNVYLAVPTNLEGKLLQLLNVQPFSTSVKVRVQSDGGTLSGEDIRRSIDPLQPLPPRYKNKISSQLIGDAWGRLYN